MKWFVLNPLSERWFWNEDTASAVRIGLLKIALKSKKSSSGFCVDSNAVNSSASYNSTTARGADNSNSCAPSLSPQYAIALGDKQVWQHFVDVQAASSFPLFESAELKFTLYSHSAKSLLHCHFHFRNVATGDVAVQQKFTQLHSAFPWEEKQWYSSTMNLLFLPAVLCMSLVPYVVKGWTFLHSFARSKRFLDPHNDHLELSKPGVKYLGREAMLLGRRAQFVCAIAHLKFVRDRKVGVITFCNGALKLFAWPWRLSLFLVLFCLSAPHIAANYSMWFLSPYSSVALLFLCAVGKYCTESLVSVITLCIRVLQLFGWPERVSLFLIFLFVFFHCTTNLALWSLFSPPNGQTLTLQSVAAAYGSTDVDITSKIIWPAFGNYFDARSSIQIVRYFLSAYIVLFAWRLLSFLTLWPTCKPVFHALQMTIVNKNVIIFVAFIVIFSIVIAMSGLIAFGREDEEHYGTPMGSWMTTFLYLTGEEQARDIINKPMNVFSSYPWFMDLSFLFPFGEHPNTPHRPPCTPPPFDMHPPPQASTSCVPSSAPWCCATSSCRC